MRWLLAGWLVMLPWFTQATPPQMPHDIATVAVEMPCHGDTDITVVESDAPDCPHCTGDSLATCKCCYYAAAAALPVLEVNAHLQIGFAEAALPQPVADPPCGRQERLYRPPIRRFI